MKRRFLCAALCAATLGAVAQDRSERERTIFRALDMDGDGSISQAEARWGRNVLESIAADPASAGSGSSAAPARPPSALFRKTDRNNDGYLTDSEMWNAPLPWGSGWMAMDRNQDGRIAPGEFDTLRGR